MSHRHRTIPDAKFEFGTFSVFADMMYKLPVSKREQVMEFKYLPLKMGLTFLKK